MLSKKLVIQGQEFFIDGRLLGSGSQGEVFRIIHAQTGVVYAVKIVRVENASAKDSMAHEINILKLISSPYIISILPFSIISDRFSYMIMDYCESGDLKQHFRMLSKGPGVNEAQVKKLIYDCTQGYKQLQRHKILHMDIKLQNILMKAGNYALSDFGLAINMNSDNRRYGGSMLYLSPSRFIKGNQVSSADDMFAFGIVCCEFANNLMHPYYANEVLKGAGKNQKESVMEFLYKHMMKVKPVLPIKLSAGLLQLLERMIERKAITRITWHELEQIVDHSALFADVRETANTHNIHLVMPPLSEKFTGTEQQKVRQSCVRVDLLNSKFSMQEPKVIEAVYEQVRNILQSRLNVCAFIVRVFDIIQVYNMKGNPTKFSGIQSSMLSIIEQLIDLENIGDIKVLGLENAPECIQIQVDKIQQQFYLTLAIKNKVTLMRQYFKLEGYCNGISTELSYEVHHFEEKIGDMLKEIEITSDMKEIEEDNTVQTALFKLVLYLLNQVQQVLREPDWKLQSKLVPHLDKYDLSLKNYGNPQLEKAVRDYIIEDGGFVVTILDFDGCRELTDDFDELDQPPQLIQLNTIGTSPQLY